MAALHTVVPTKRLSKVFARMRGISGSMSPGFLLRNGSDRMERVRKGYIPVKNNKGGGGWLGKLELMRRSVGVGKG